MYDYQEQFRNYVKEVGKVLLDIVNKAYKDIEQEEVDFNGRWCDDGGKAVE